MVAGPVVTGVPSVDAALARLDGLADTPLAEHPPVYEQVDAGLRSALDSPADPDAADADTADPDAADADAVDSGTPANDS